MGMSRVDVAKHIEQGNFAIFDKVSEQQYVTVANAVVDAFCDDFFRSSNPDNWIEFMRQLHAAPPRFLKMPEHMVKIFRLVSLNDSAKTEYRCAQLMMLVLDGLANMESINLNGNLLLRFCNTILTSPKSHDTVIKLIDMMSEDEKKKAYRYLLDQYIQNPSALYIIYLSGNYGNLFSNLMSVAKNEDESFFIEKMQDIFKNASEKGIEEKMWPTCYFLRDLNSNEVPIENLDQKVFFKLKRVTTQSEKVFEKLREMISSDAKLDKKVASLALANLDELRRSDDSEKILEFTNQMNKFLADFSNLDHQQKEGLLTSAQIASRKKYGFNTVVLNESQIYEFFETLSRAEKPLRKRFIVTGNHWVACDVEVDKDGCARLAVFDSLGSYSSSSVGMYSDTFNLIAQFSDKFPFSPVYFSDEQRQNTPTGCSVNAKDDMLHGFNLDVILKKSVFDYFADQAKPAIEVKRASNLPVTLYRCNLPLSLMRKAQTERYYSAVKRGAHKLPDEVVNKTGDFFTQNSEKFFKPKPRNEPGRMNTRLEYELKKIAKFNAIYLLTHDEATIAADMQKFTLDSYQKECASKKPIGRMEDDNPILHRAIIDGNAADAVALLKAGEDPYNKNSRGRSAMDIAIHAPILDEGLASYLLIKAVIAGDQLIAERLLQRGADPNNKDVRIKFGEYPLHTAVRMGSDAFVEMLVSNKARKNVEDKYGDQPLEVALENPKLSLISRLLNDDDELVVNYISNADTVYEAQSNNDWGELSLLLLCADRRINIDARDKEVITKNLLPIFNSFCSQLSSVSDEHEKIRLLNLASDSGKFLGSHFLKEPEIVMRINSAIDREAEMLTLKELERYLDVSTPRLE